MHPTECLVYRFDRVEVNAARGCLRRNGQEIHLPQKPLQVLVYLVEQHERLVTKEELMEVVWKDVAVTDDALVQCVVDIRKALGDDPRNPRFIKTVARVGYRFVGPVEVRRPEALTPIATEEITSLKVEYEEEIPDAFPLAARGQRGVPALPAPQRLPLRQGLTVAFAVFLVGALGVVVGRREGVFSSRRPRADATLPHVPGKKSVAVMYFENGSGNAELDWLRGGLADMLITDLSRSTRFTMLGRQQLQAIRERAGYRQPRSAPLEEALDIARKSRAEMLVLGSFAKLGEKMRIDAQVYDARTGQMSKAESLIVDRPEQILTQVDLLSLKLADDLGAGLAAEERQTTLAAAMTNNLEAYRYYSLGLEKAQGLHNKEAIALLKRAVALDPQFAMAHARIGYAYTVMWGFTDEAKPHLEKAFQLSSRLTEKDRLNITGWYGIANLDYPGAIRSFRELIARYPTEVEAYWRLAQLLTGEEQGEEAIEVAKRGLVIDPEEQNLYNVLGGIYSGLGRHGEAVAAEQRYVALAPQEANAHDSLGIAYQWAGQYDRAMEEYGRAIQLNPEFEIAVVHLGNVYFQMGRYREALRLYRRYLDMGPASLERSRANAYLAWVYYRKGELDRAEHSARNLPPTLDPVLVRIPLIVARERGDLPTVEFWRNQRAAKARPARGSRPTLRPSLYARGYLALKSGQGADAIADFKEALRHRPATWDIDAHEDCLADAYLELGQLDEAIAEYERVLRLNPNYPLAHYHLGQAHDQKGQGERARSEYEQFLRIWKDADPDIPEVIAARRSLGEGGES
jgi:tetratricopeptide (TPR) repeat protein/DNA-binding winged helix-turn-helix (wHTH) protein